MRWVIWHSTFVNSASLQRFKFAKFWSISETYQRINFMLTLMLEKGEGVSRDNIWCRRFNWHQLIPPTTHAYWQLVVVQMLKWNNQKTAPEFSHLQNGILLCQARPAHLLIKSSPSVILIPAPAWYCIRSQCNIHYSPNIVLIPPSIHYQIQSQIILIPAKAWYLTWY